MNSLSRFKLRLLAGFVLTVAIAVTFAASVQWLRGGGPRSGSLSAVTELPAPAPLPSHEPNVAPTPAPQPTAQAIPPRWTPAVPLTKLADLANMDPWLNRALGGPRAADKLTMTGGRGRETAVRTYREYLASRQQGFVAKSPADAAVESAAKLQLYPLLYLRQACPAQVSYVASFDVVADPLAELPVTLLPAFSPERQRQVAALAASGGAWKQVLPRTRVQPDGRFAVRISDRDYEMKLTTLAWADFNRDGYEDVLLSAVCAAKPAGGQTCRFIVLTRTAPAARLIALDVRE